MASCSLAATARTLRGRGGRIHHPVDASAGNVVGVGNDYNLLVVNLGFLIENAPELKREVDRRVQ